MHFLANSCSAAEKVPPNAQTPRRVSALFQANSVKCRLQFSFQPSAAHVSFDEAYVDIRSECPCRYESISVMPSFLTAVCSFAWNERLPSYASRSANPRKNGLIARWNQKPRVSMKSEQRDLLPQSRLRIWLTGRLTLVLTMPSSRNRFRPGLGVWSWEALRVKVN